MQLLEKPSFCLYSCVICKVLNASISFCLLQSKNMKCNRQTAGYSVALCLPSGLEVLASRQDPSTCDISDSFNQTMLKTVLIEFSQLPEKFIYWFNQYKNFSKLFAIIQTFHISCDSQRTFFLLCLASTVPQIKQFQISILFFRDQISFTLFSILLCVLL